MATNTPLDDDTPRPSSLKTLTDLPIPSNPAARSAHAPSAIQARADLNAAKGAASLLSEGGLRELKAWIEMKLATRRRVLEQTSLETNNAGGELPHAGAEQRVTLTRGRSCDSGRF